MSKYKDLATIIIENVGGKENVNQVVHCATRLRFRLKDTTKTNTEMLKKTKGVLSVIDAGGQYQVVIGPDVGNVYQEVVDLGGFESMAQMPEEESSKNQNKVSQVLEFIASIFQPIIPAITGAGLLKAFMALFVALKVLDNSTQTYTLLNTFADAAFYFLPVLLAASAAKRFKCNQFTAMALGGILVYPSFITLVSTAKEAGTGIRMFGVIPITLASYSSSVIPIILGVWCLSYIEKWIAKISPKAIKFFSVPLVSILVSGILTLSILGPLGTWIGLGIAGFFKWLDSTASWAVPTLVGTISPLMVMTGTHYGLIPIGINNLATTGFDTVVGPGMLASNVAQGAAGLAVAMRSKNKDTKELAGSAGITGLLGITEPILYGVNLKFIYPLIGAMIGGFSGGLYMGITHTGRYASGSPGLLVLPAYIGGVGMTNFFNAVVGSMIAIVVSFVATFILFSIYARQGKLEASEIGKKEISEVADGDIVAVVDGTILKKDEVADAMFAEEILGKTFAILPKDGIVGSPVNGTIEMIYDTGHAFGIRANDGSVILVHIGVDTVKMEGKGFHVLKKQGDYVKAGEPVVEVDFSTVNAAGCPTQTFVIITEPVKDRVYQFKEEGSITRGEVI